MNDKAKRSLLWVVAGVGFLILILYLISSPEPYRPGPDVRWYPKSIQKDRIGYLRHAKNELENAKDRLEARLISLKFKRSGFERKHAEAMATKTRYAKLLESLLPKYEGAKNNNTTSSYPIVIDKIRIEDEASLIKIAVKTKKTLDHQNKLEDTHALFQKKLTALVTKCENQIEKLNGKRAGFDLPTESALLKFTEDELSDLHDTLVAVIDTSVEIASEPDIDPDVLIDAVKVTAVETEFQEVLDWYYQKIKEDGVDGNKTSVKP